MYEGLEKIKNLKVGEELQGSIEVMRYKIDDDTMALEDKLCDRAFSYTLYKMEGAGLALDTQNDMNKSKLVGALDGGCHFKGKLVRFGYIELAEKHSNFLPPNEKIKAHEFHYYDSTDNGADCIATKPATGRSYDCVISHDNYWLGFPHLYYPSNPHFAESLVRKAYEYRRKNGKLL